MKLFLFDIDHTLLYAGGAAKSAFDTAFAALFSVQDVWSNYLAHGMTDPVIFQELAEKALNRNLTALEYACLCERYLEQLEEKIHNSSGFTVKPGAAELCSLLAGCTDTHLALQTGNLERAAFLKLKRAGLDGYFGCGGFGSDSGDRAEIVKLAITRAREQYGCSAHDSPQTILIGDAPQDILAGKASGVTTIAVATGLSSKEQLTAYQPDLVLNSLLEVEAIMEAAGLEPLILPT